MISGTKIKELREQAGITGVELGDAVGASQSMIAHIERGYKVPSADLLARIADYFGVAMDDLRKKESV